MTKQTAMKAMVPIKQIFKKRELWLVESRVFICVPGF